MDVPLEEVGSPKTVVDAPREAESPECAGVPGHPWDEKGLQRQKGVGPLVSIPGTGRGPRPGVTNRSSTGRQPVILFPQTVYIGFNTFVLAHQGPWRLVVRLQGHGVLLCRLQQGGLSGRKLKILWTQNIRTYIEAAFWRASDLYYKPIHYFKGFFKFMYEHAFKDDL